jgi:hypothetical protein
VSKKQTGARRSKGGKAMITWIGVAVAFDCHAAVAEADVPGA